MLLVPLLVRVGVIAGLLVAVHHLASRLRLTDDSPAEGHEALCLGCSSLTTPVESDSIQSSSETGNNATVPGEAGASSVLVSINGESFVFRYIPESTTYGDLAAEFCKTQGTSLGLGDMRLRFKDCVLPLERQLREALEKVVRSPCIDGI